MPSLQTVPGAQRAERADRIPEAEWEEHREIIKSLYLDHGMRLESLTAHMEKTFGFKASEQQYKIQFNRWNLRKNKRRLDQRAPSPDLEQPRLAHPTLRTNGYPAHGNAQLGGVNPINEGPMDIQNLPVSWNNGFNAIGGVQPSGLEAGFAPVVPYSNPYYYAPTYGAPQPPYYAQAQPPMNTTGFPAPQFNVQSGSQAAQEHFRLNHYVDGSGGASQMPTRQASCGSTTATKPSRQAIHQTVQCGSLRGAKLLLDADPECAHALDEENIGPAWIAAQGGYADILRLLITQKVKLNVPSHKNNRYAIHQAAQGGHTQVVKMLLQNGADHDPVDDGGVTPLWLAAQGGHHEIVEMLLKHNSPGKKADVETESHTGERRAIHQAAQEGHLKVVQLLLAEKAECDPVDQEGVTPLWSAAQNGSAEVVRELLKAGAKVNVTPYEHSRQPIHQAAQGGHLEVVKALVEHGRASLTPEEDTFDESEASPFLLACSSNNPELVNHFLDRGVDVNSKTRKGKGPLHCAAHSGHVKVGQLLIDRRCDVDSRESKGWTPLIIAAQDGHLPFVNLLIDNDANINSQENDGATALWIAAQQGHANIVGRLLKGGAKQLSTKESGRRPIHQAAQNGHLACVKLLLKHSPKEIDVAARDGFTALTLASQKDKPENLAVMRYLVNAGAKVI
ncbi:ankyrin repeat-containing domain protein [Chaetomium fimeti]|uniref:Ankyrin repeat-containing domain protein n=1 Tax=Chaetomium fimeti TaxID=1854472 RepID=A0AAE0LLT1_9PEZI|nr:ankyrin repeat-containing domain protein [Chaetomium fimeti]